jgi:signal peptidase I
MTRKLLTRALPTVLTLAFVAGLWATLAPPQLGGRTMLATSYGSSMEPMIHRGDVIVLRKGGPAKVGDVVGYRSELIGRLVVHRVHRIEDGKLVLKGDNNDFLDPDLVPQSAVVGHLVYHVPQAGFVMEELRKPQSAAGLGVLAAFFLAGGSGRKRRQEEQEETPVDGRVPDGAALWHGNALWGVGSLALLSSIAVLLGLSRGSALASVGAAGLAVSAAVFAAITIVERRTRVPGEAAAIARRLGRHMLTVDAIDSGDAVVVVVLSSIDELIGIAEEYERLVLHQQCGTEHVYSVLEDRTIYRYELAA